MLTRYVTGRAKRVYSNNCQTIEFDGAHVWRDVYTYTRIVSPTRVVKNYVLRATLLTNKEVQF